MSSYPGETPEPPQDPAPEAPGYWERQAAERAQESPGYDAEYTAPITPSGPAPTFDPSSGRPAEPSYGQPAYAPQPSYGQPPAGGYQPAPYQQGPYQPAPYQQGPYQQGPYGQPGYAGAGYGYGQQNHPRATTAMVLGLVSLIGALFTCGLSLLLAPFAWGVGQSALKQLRLAQGRFGGQGQARAGQVMGIIGTVLLAIAIGVIVWFAVEIGHYGFSEGSAGGTST